MTPLYFVTDRLLASAIIPFLPQRLTPNYLTTFRFLTIPFIFFLLIFNYYFWSGLIFLIAAFTDALDGALARTTNQITDWGKLFDPLADKLLVGSTTAVLVSRFLSLGLAAAIVGAELFLILLAYYHKYYRQRDVQANYLGKTKMVLQSLGLLALFGAVSFSQPILFRAAAGALDLALVFALLSFFGYRSI